MIYQEIMSRRTIRKYAQKDVPREVLLRCVDAARLSPSGANRQPLKYVIVNDQELIKDVFSTAGIAAMSISMVAYDEGLGSCILGAVDREKLRGMLKVPDGLDIVLVVALGYAAESPVADKMKDGDVKYWLDKNGVLHVPKRSLEEVVKWNRY